MNLHDQQVLDFIDGCYKAGIKDPLSFLISKRPQVYDWLRDVFPRGILPTDIDGEVEINGHFLRLEFKHESALRNGLVPKGQLRAFHRLQETGRFTVALIGHNDINEPTCFEAYHENGARAELKDCNKLILRSWFRKWVEHVEGKKQTHLARTA